MIFILFAGFLLLLSWVTGRGAPLTRAREGRFSPRRSFVEESSGRDLLGRGPPRKPLECGLFLGLGTGGLLGSVQRLQIHFLNRKWTINFGNAEILDPKISLSASDCAALAFLISALLFSPGQFPLSK